MKILVSAVACSPYHGSEGYFGWSAVLVLARDHELWVLTHRRVQAELEQATAEGLVPAKVRFAYAGDFQPWHPNRMRARLQSWREYQRFPRAILPLARKLHAREKFDLAHHVTYATWRVASARQIRQGQRGLNQFAAPLKKIAPKLWGLFKAPSQVQQCNLWRRENTPRLRSNREQASFCR